MKGGNNMKIFLDVGAYMPTYAHDADAGMDLRTPVAFIVPAHGDYTVDTGVHIQIPTGFVGFIKSKSGLNVNSGLTATGVVDALYDGSCTITAMRIMCSAAAIKSRKWLFFRLLSLT